MQNSYSVHACKMWSLTWSWVLKKERNWSLSSLIIRHSSSNILIITWLIQSSFFDSFHFLSLKLYKLWGTDTLSCAIHGLNCSGIHCYKVNLVGPCWFILLLPSLNWFHSCANIFNIIKMKCCEIITYRRHCHAIKQLTRITMIIEWYGMNMDWNMLYSRVLQTKDCHRLEMFSLNTVCTVIRIGNDTINQHKLLHLLIWRMEVNWGPITWPTGARFDF